jgi:hypothetical protein
MKQFWESLGERGEITFYDRGWYTSAVEQALFGLTKADPKEIKKLTKKVRKLPASERAAAISQNEEAARIVYNYRQIACNFEKMLIDDGYIVAKLFLHISKEEQRSRLEALRKNPDTAWRVSKQKLKMMDYYDEAYGFYDELLTGSDFRFAPWVIINGEDRRAANLQIAQTLVDALERALSSAPDEAAEEAKMLLDLIKGYDINLPVVYDWETVFAEDARTNNMQARGVTDCALTFCQIIEEAGYTPMVYFNTYQSLNLMHLEELKQYEFWLAWYSDLMRYPYQVRMWQYTDSGRVPGIDTNVDLNVYMTE